MTIPSTGSILIERLSPMGPTLSSPTSSSKAFASLSLWSSPSWQRDLWQSIQLESSDPASRYASMASIGEDSRPHVRTVVMRGTVAELLPHPPTSVSDQLWMITDHRSAKFNELKHQPWVEIAWYFRQSREQFRLSGQISLLESPETTLRESAWKLLSTTARVQFFWPEPLAIRRLEQQTNFDIAHDAPCLLDPPASFVLMCLDVTSVDHLRLNGNPQDRTIYNHQPNNQWSIAEVNP